MTKELKQKLLQLYISNPPKRKKKKCILVEVPPTDNRP